MAKSLKAPNHVTSTSYDTISYKTPKAAKRAKNASAKSLVKDNKKSSRSAKGSKTLGGTTYGVPRKTKSEKLVENTKARILKQLKSKGLTNESAKRLTDNLDKAFQDKNGVTRITINGKSPAMVRKMLTNRANEYIANQLGINVEDLAAPPFTYKSLLKELRDFLGNKDTNKSDDGSSAYSIFIDAFGEEYLNDGEHGKYKRPISSTAIKKLLDAVDDDNFKESLRDDLDMHAKKLLNLV